jgi:plastocyanin
MFSIRESYFAMAEMRSGAAFCDRSREGSGAGGVSLDMTRLRSSLIAVAICAAVVAGCGGSDSSSSGGGGYGGVPAKTTTATTTPATPAASAGAELALKADESSGLAFDPKSLSAKAGKVTITMDNPDADSLPHAIAVEGPGAVRATGETVQPGGTSKVSLDLKPGTYTFYCPVGSHRSAGMEGTLTVR